jgi:phospholipase C
MNNRRDFIKKASLLSGGAGLLNTFPQSIIKALAIDPAPGSTYLDAEHIVFLMQENRSFDHTYGSLQGVRGFNDPRAIRLPNKNLVWLQTNNAGETYAPFRLNIKDTNATWMSSLPHSWPDQVDARNKGKYDKWLDTKRSGHQPYAQMPLTMGYYTRADIPFYYSLADAFTICDQNFCSSLTGTTPNRLYFWTGTIRAKQDADSMAHVWNHDAEPNKFVSWKTFPERLEDLGVSWKIYQNELYLDVGFEGEEEGWLSNFGDNPIEYLSQYKVKFHPEYIANLPIAAEKLSKQIKNKEGLLASQSGPEAETTKKDINWLRTQLAIVNDDRQIYTPENFERLSAYEKAIHQKAFCTNRADPHFHELESLAYNDGNTPREMNVPKGDILCQFRNDVLNGTLPSVSWIAAPENFSDHPSSAWYGAWYISEVMDILTQNPEVWKKTIFILTYDENDGYFDHIPPFTPPHPSKESTGKTSAGIDTSIDYVTNIAQQSYADKARISPIGLGYRVPLVVVSPWSRGGWVCSQVFDHTSSLLFLETFLSNKLKKKIEDPNISSWRRAICGDLTASFRPYNGEKINTPPAVERNEFVKSIHKAKFKKEPANFRKLTMAEIELINKQPISSSLIPAQEKGTRLSCSLPYELYADGNLDRSREFFTIKMKAGNKIFGTKASGSAFQVYAPGKFLNEFVRTWDYAAAAGNEIEDRWPLGAFENGIYHLRVYGPNGFYREFSGKKNDPSTEFECLFEPAPATPSGVTGNVLLRVVNNDEPISLEIIDNAYKSPRQLKTIGRGGQSKNIFLISTARSFGWYDFSVKVKGNSVFEKRYAGRIETGMHSRTDPFMGRSV